MMHTPQLSKSRYLSGAQCALRLWHDTFAPTLAGAPDEVAKAAFDTGREVGEAARRRYPGGLRVGHDHRHLEQALEETRRLIASGAAPALFEAAFEHRGVLVRADVLERLPAGGWRLLEVKSGTRMKDPFLLDAALQLWVLRGAGLDVRDAAVLTLNRDYVFDGAHLDLEALFTAHPVFDEASALRDDIGAQVRALRAMLARPAAPDIAPGAHCLTPHACPYHATCTRDAVVPEHCIGELPRLAARRRVALQAARVEDIRDIPADFPLTAPQRIVARVVREGRALVHGDLPGALSRLAPPVRHLDFETFAPTLPRFAGTRPCDAIPFLFSVHTERDGAPPAQVDYLHERDDDPRPALAERLIAALGREGTVCAYSGYERQVLRALAAALPRRAEALRAVEARLFDLLPVVRNGYYHPAFRGSFSLKRVLPVLVPGLGYDDLAIADGQTAAVRYAGALAHPDPEERRRTFGELRAYCARDTLAMVRLREAFARLEPDDCA